MGCFVQNWHSNWHFLNEMFLAYILTQRKTERPKKIKNHIRKLLGFCQRKNFGHTFWLPGGGFFYFGHSEPN
jgi:hypothetical protein